MRLDENGRLGIGTTTINAFVDISGLGPVGRGLRIKETSASKSNGVYTFEVDSSSHTSNLSAAGAMKVDVNSGTAFVITGQGNIGMGITPTEKLHVLGNGIFTGDVTLTDLKSVKLAGFLINAIGNSSTSFALNWNNGAYQSVTLTNNASISSQTAPSGDGSNGWRLQLDIVQDGTGGRDFTPPSNWVFPDGEPVWTEGTAGQRIIITAMYNGTNYVCTSTSWFTNP
jgi:hypothetical protein